MRSKIDLHMHSSISSDGEYCPSELMKRCAESGLKLVSLTDHNSVRGIREAEKAACENNVQFITGIELDCQFEGKNLHLLGYQIDPEYPEFEENEKVVIQKERMAATEQMKLVRALGFLFENQKILDLAGTGIVTPEIIGEAVLEDERNNENARLLPYRTNGSRSDNPLVNFYWDFCAQGKLAYVPITYIEIQEAVQMIERAGGVAILAHPGITFGKDRQFVQRVMDCGILGIEVYSSYHDQDMIMLYKELAEEGGYLQSRGSDYHGKIKPSIKLGFI